MDREMDCVEGQKMERIPEQRENFEGSENTEKGENI